MIRLVWTGLRLPELKPPVSIDVIHKPSMSIQKLPMDEVFFRSVSPDSTIAFTSRTAVEMFDLPLTDHTGSIYAVGKGTAAALSRRFKRAIRSPLCPGVAPLGALLACEGVGSVISVTVENSKNRLKGNFEVVEIPVYRSEFLGVGKQVCDAIVITSPLAARSVSDWEDRPPTFVYGIDASAILSDAVRIKDMADVWKVVATTLDI